MPVYKKDRKYGKEIGGIAAAVTRQTAGKFSFGNDGNSAFQHLPDGPPPLEVTPDPDADSQVGGDKGGKDYADHYRDDDNDDDNNNDKNAAPTAPSPLLDALSATSVSVSTAPSMANDWARAGVGSSPSNLINLSSGESPPTQPSSYEDSARLRHGWPIHGPFAPSSPSPASASPPRSGHRPLSFQIDAQYNSNAPASLSAVSTAAPRRSPIHTNFPAHRASYHSTTLAHKTQAHFYGAQDLDLTVTPQAGSMKAGDSGCFFGLDSLPAVDGSASSKQVALAGYEGGLKVYTVSKRGLDLAIHLRGLHGGVHCAKIVPWTINGAAGETPSPLVVMVIHGPVLCPSPGGNSTQPSPAAKASSSARAPPTAGSQDASLGRGQSGISSYQTTVEAFSLKTHKRVDVILRAPEIAINREVSLTSPLFRAPAPSGAFTIKADGGTVAVCSGVTGECWVFRQQQDKVGDQGLVCCGKLWTTLHQNVRNDALEEMDKARLSSATTRVSVQRTPVLDLCGRWIAYCPATASSQITLGARITVPVLPRAPGANSQTPPHPPSPMAATDESVSDSMVNKIMRETTQELIQGAKWMSQQGMQAWNSYWNKPSQEAGQQNQPVSSPPHGAVSRTVHEQSAQFPPTHGAASQPVAKQPGVVSIVDAPTMANSSSIHPLTVFCPTQGCSFLSFSPSGLGLFTASTKGDVQDVWDLARFQHTHSSVLQSTLPNHDSTGPTIRQMAHFTRMTVARVVEVAWTEPHGQKLAVVTERGTVHVLDMPFSAFMWPPLRRRKVEGKTAPENAEAATSAVSIASGALGAAYQAARPFVTRSRRSSAATPATAGHSLRDSAAQGGRAIAASISQSLGKTGTAISQWRNASECRVCLPVSSSLPAAGCVRWLKVRKTWVLVAVGGGAVRLFPRGFKRHPLSSSRNRFAGESQKYVDYKVPQLPNDGVAPLVRQVMDMGVGEEFLDLSDIELEAGNTTTLKIPTRTAPRSASLEDAIPHAEIESSAPYQPFHTDRRVVLGEYNKAHLSPRPQPEHKPVPEHKPEPESTPVAEVMDEPKPVAEVADAEPVPVHDGESALDAAPDTNASVDKAPQDPSMTKKKKKKAQGAASKQPTAKAGQPVAKTEPTAAKAGQPAVAPETPATNPEPMAVKSKETAKNPKSGTAEESTEQTASKPASEAQLAAAPPAAWAFGQDIPFTRINIGRPQGLDYDESNPDGSGVPLAMERVMDYGDEQEIVVTTRRSRSSRQGEAQDGFFEDDCEVWDFADQRV